MKKIIYKIANPIRKLYWRIFRPRTFGVKCLVENNGRYLLVKNSYGKKFWTVPGGGLNKKESPEEAVRREVREELGIEVQEIKKIGEYESALEYKRDTIFCFRAQSPSEKFSINHNEISEAQWFTPKDIPESHSTAVGKILEMI